MKKRTHSRVQFTALGQVVCTCNNPKALRFHVLRPGWGKQSASFQHSYLENTALLCYLFVKVSLVKRTSLERDDGKNILNAKDYRIWISIHVFVCINNPVIYILPPWSSVSNSPLALYIINCSKILFKIFFFSSKLYLWSPKAKKYTKVYFKWSAHPQIEKRKP